MSIVPPFAPNAPDLPDVTPLALWVLGAYLEPIMAWVSAQVYAP
jgi:hypothetical protein